METAPIAGSARNADRRACGNGAERGLGGWTNRRRQQTRRGTPIGGRGETAPKEGSAGGRTAAERRLGEERR